ncbi:MAG TPA: prepilin-type N-terminal cleavage/methylation domain-containing protein [Candidatus Margulisiibacteriota bacterium]|nr:prepilin-type N-terminal cleavage/methylation domain-containing protein [Candidatus Margulisiibacteriota bacterium]
MPISTAASRSAGGLRRRVNQSGSAGFTLLEISLVLLIMAVVLMLALPRLRDPGRAELLSQSKRLVNIFKLLRSEAVLNGYAYRLNYDLGTQRYWVTADESADLGDFVRELGQLARGTQLREPVAIADVVLPTLAGKINQGQIYTVFYPDGSVDPTVIHLATPREAYTLWLNPMNGRLNIAAGYHDVDFAG